MQPTEGSSCHSREILWDRLQADLKVYRDAVVSLELSPDFKIAHERAESARLVYEASRENFNEHIAAHGCGAS
jgi:hypothetical protein